MFSLEPDPPLRGGERLVAASFGAPVSRCLADPPGELVVPILPVVQGPAFQAGAPLGGLGRLYLQRSQLHVVQKEKSCSFEM